jgi:pimeloyl-ACP methyl ester carboxylesterase
MPAPTTAPKLPRRRFKRRYVYGTLIVAYALLMTSSCVADRLILFPSTVSIPTPGATKLSVQTPSGEQVEVFTARTRSSRDAEPEAFLLVFIGNADRAERGVYYGLEQADRHPVEVWAMNYPGYGGSAGEARLKSIGPAALATYDALRARAGNRPIFISGGSLGTTAALHVAANRPVAGLILANPPPLRQMIVRRHGWWNLWLLAGPIALQVPADLDSVANARKSTAPAVFVLAGSDTVIPPVYQQMVVKAYTGEKRIVNVPDADHNDPPQGDAAEEARGAIEWLWKRSPSASSTLPTSAPS